MAFGMQDPGGTTPGVTGRPPGRLTRPKPVFALHPNRAQMPEFMKRADELMKTYGDSGLPSGLQPRWMRNRTNLHISKGMTKGT